MHSTVFLPTTDRGRVSSTRRSADLFGVVHQQRDPGAHPRLDEHVRHRGPVLIEHQPHLVQHRRHGGQPGRTGQPFGVLPDQAVDDQRQLVGRDLGFCSNPPLLHHL